MQYEAKSPEEYLQNLDPDWRKEKLETVRQWILNASLSISECMEYKMLAYELNSVNVFHLNAQSAYVSLYVGDIDKVKNAREMLQPFSLGKGCIRIKKSVDLPQTELKRFIEKTIEVWKKGENTAC